MIKYYQLKSWSLAGGASQSSSLGSLVCSCSNHVFFISLSDAITTNLLPVYSLHSTGWRSVALPTTTTTAPAALPH